MYHQPGTTRCSGGNRNVLRSFGPCAQAATSAHPSALACSAAQVQSPVLSYRHLLGRNSQLLGGYLLLDNLAVTYFIAIRIYQSGDQGLTKSEAGINGYYPPMRSDG